LKLSQVLEKVDKQLTKKKRGKKWKRCQIIGKNRKTIGSNRKREEISKTVRKDGTIRNWKAMATQHFLMYHLETVPTAGHGPSILA
jgi:hypothetical protein